MNPLRLQTLGPGLSRSLGTVWLGTVPATGAITVGGASAAALSPVPAALGILFALFAPAGRAVALGFLGFPLASAGSAVAVGFLWFPLAPAGRAVAVGFFAVVAAIIGVCPAPVLAGRSGPVGAPLASVAVVFVSVPGNLAAALVGGQPGRHQGAGIAAHQLKALGLGPFRLGLEDGYDVEPVEMDIGLDPQDVAHRSRLGDQGAVQVALRPTGAGGPPSPSPVVAAAGELDVEPASHEP